MKEGEVFDRRFRLLLLVGNVALTASIIIALFPLFALFPAVLHGDAEVVIRCMPLIGSPIGQMWAISKASDLWREGDKPAARTLVVVQTSFATLVIAWMLIL